MKQLANPTTRSAQSNVCLRLTLYCCLGLIFLATQVSAQIVINELMADPASDWDGDGLYSYRNDEWVEVANTSSEAVNLSNYWLTDSATDLLRYNLSGIIQPGEVAVFYGSQVVAWQQENGVTTTGLSLNNGGDTVNLFYLDTPTSDPVTIDSRTYLDHEGEDDRSCGLSARTGLWVLYDGLNLYTGTHEPQTSGINPSPAEPNFPDPLPNSTLTFGELKALYR